MGASLCAQRRTTCDAWKKLLTCHYVSGLQAIGLLNNSDELLVHRTEARFAIHARRYLARWKAGKRAMAKRMRVSCSKSKAAAKRPVAAATLLKRPVPKAAAVKPAAQRAAARQTTALEPPKRRKQRPAVSHYREDDFVAGPHGYAKYRDLGVAEASGGLAQARVIRLIGPYDPDQVAKLGYHDAEFQLIYVLNGWVKIYLGGVGETTMRQGSSWTQPPRIKHAIRDYSDNCELLNVMMPAQFKALDVKS